MKYQWNAWAMMILISMCSFAGGCALSGVEGIEEEVTVSPAGAPCTTDADCHLAADYCSGGCACLSLTQGQKAPSCSVHTACFADPCLGKVPTCISGQCSTGDPAEY